jgi:hypothetical protein
LYEESCSFYNSPLNSIKRAAFLIDLLAKLKNQRQDWVCWLIGDGPFRNQLTHKVNKQGLGGHVKFLGNQENVPSILKETDLFVFQQNLHLYFLDSTVSRIEQTVEFLLYAKLISTFAGVTDLKFYHG